MDASEATTQARYIGTKWREPIIKIVCFLLIAMEVVQAKLFLLPTSSSCFSLSLMAYHDNRVRCKKGSSIERSVAATAEAACNSKRSRTETSNSLIFSIERNFSWNKRREVIIFNFETIDQSTEKKKEKSVHHRALNSIEIRIDLRIARCCCCDIRLILLSLSRRRVRPAQWNIQRLDPHIGLSSLAGESSLGLFFSSLSFLLPTWHHIYRSSIRFFVLPGKKKEFRPDTRQANWSLLSFLACNADEKKVNGFNPPTNIINFSRLKQHMKNTRSVLRVCRERSEMPPLKKCRNRLKNMTAEQRKLKALTLLYTQVTFESLPSPLIWPSNTAANIHSGFGLLTKYMIIRARTFYLPVCTKCEKVVPPNSTVKTISPFNHTNIAMWASKNHKPPLLVTLIEKSVF